MQVFSNKLKNIDLDSNVVTSIIGEPETLSVDETLTDSSPRPVTSKGIHEFFQELSANIQWNIIDEINHGLSVEENGIVPNGYGVVRSSDIYTALLNLSTDICNKMVEDGIITPTVDENTNNNSDDSSENNSNSNDNNEDDESTHAQLTQFSQQVQLMQSSMANLSDEILLSAYDADLTLVGNVTRTGGNPVKSSGIWTFGNDLSAAVCNQISSEYAKTTDIVDLLITQIEQLKKSSDQTQFNRLKVALDIK